MTCLPLWVKALCYSLCFASLSSLLDSSIHSRRICSGLVRLRYLSRRDLALSTSCHKPLGGVISPSLGRVQIDQSSARSFHAVLAHLELDKVSSRNQLKDTSKHAALLAGVMQPLRARGLKQVGPFEKVTLDETGLTVSPRGKREVGGDGEHNDLW